MKLRKIIVCLPFWAWAIRDSYRGFVLFSQWRWALAVVVVDWHDGGRHSSSCCSRVTWATTINVGGQMGIGGTQARRARTEGTRIH